MHARVVRFTDASAERIEAIGKQVAEEDGPPPELPAKGMQMMYDASQSTAVVVVFFESEEDMRKGAEYLDGLDSGETPGTRSSVDLCEVKVDITA